MYNQELRGLIVNSGFTQKQFAKHIGLDEVTMSYIIRGKNRKLKHLQLIADYFNKPVSTIFKGGNYV